MRHKQGVLIIIVITAAFVLFFFNANSQNERDYSSFSAGVSGASLLYDTLQKLRLPVSMGYFPLNKDSAVNEVYIIIHPNDPVLSEGMVEEILAWVQRGGRLIYLESRYPTRFDVALLEYGFTDLGALALYPVGMGIVVTGYAEDVVNQSLMENSFTGMLIASLLESWHADKIIFAEYYHGYRANDNLFAHLPVVIKLVVYQSLIASVAYVWCRGKRFGRPVPLYTEAEREENEHVRALARLYYKTGGYKDGKRPRGSD